MNFSLICIPKYWADNKINLFRFWYQLQVIDTSTLRKVVTTKPTYKKIRIWKLNISFFGKILRSEFKTNLLFRAYIVDLSFKMKY